MSENNIPNLLLVGFQKCGSSSLFDFLQSHSEVFGSEPKETFYFSDKGYEHFNSNHSYLNEDVFSGFNNGDNNEGTKYYLEGSVNNFYQDPAVDFAINNKNVKVIFCLRDPVARFTSVYNYFGTDGIHLPPGTSINEYFDLCIAGSLKNDLLKNGIEHGRYGKYIDLWKNKIGRSRVFVTSLKKLSNDLDEVHRLFTFLDLSVPTEISFPNRNVTRVIKYPLLHANIVRLMSGHDLGDTVLARLYSKFVRGKNHSQKLSEEAAKKLKGIYKEEYLKYADLF